MYLEDLCYLQTFCYDLFVMRTKLFKLKMMFRCFPIDVKYE
jgi:hypothetical protein